MSKPISSSGVKLTSAFLSVLELELLLVLKRLKESTRRVEEARRKQYWIDGKCGELLSHTTHLSVANACLTSLARACQYSQQDFFQEVQSICGNEALRVVTSRDVATGSDKPLDKCTQEATKKPSLKRRRRHL